MPMHMFYSKQSLKGMTFERNEHTHTHTHTHRERERERDRLSGSDWRVLHLYRFLLYVCESIFVGAGRVELWVHYLYDVLLKRCLQTGHDLRK